MQKADLKHTIETIRSRLKLIAGFRSRPAAIEMGRAISEFTQAQEDKTVSFSIGFWLLEQIKPLPNQRVDLNSAIYFYHMLAIFYAEHYQALSPLAKDYAKMTITLLSLAPDYQLQILESFVLMSSVSLGVLDEPLQNELCGLLNKSFIGKKSAEGDLAAGALVNCLQSSSLILQKSIIKSITLKLLSLRHHEQRLLAYFIWSNNDPVTAVGKLMKLLGTNKLNPYKLVKAFGLGIAELPQQDLISLCWAAIDPVPLKKKFDIGPSPVQLSDEHSNQILNLLFKELDENSLNTILDALKTHPIQTVDRLLPMISDGILQMSIEDLLELPNSFFQTKTQRCSIRKISKSFLSQIPIKARLGNLSLLFAKVKSIKIESSFEETDPLVVESYMELFVGSLESFFNVDPLYLPFDLLRQIYCWTVLSSRINETGSVVWNIVYSIGKIAPFLLDVDGLLSSAPSPIKRLLIFDTIESADAKIGYSWIINEALQIIPQLSAHMLDILVRHTIVTVERMELLSNLFFTCATCNTFQEIPALIRLFEELFARSSSDARQVLVSRLSLIPKTNCNPLIILPVISSMIKTCALSSNNTVFFLESFQSCLVPFLHLDEAQKCLMQLASFGDAHFRQALVSTLMQQAVNENLSYQSRVQAISTLGYVALSIEINITMIVGFTLSVAKDSRNVELQKAALKSLDRIVLNKSMQLDDRFFEEIGAFMWALYSEGPTDLHLNLSSLAVAFVDALGINICDNSNTPTMIASAIAQEFLKSPPNIAINALSIVSRFLLLTKTFVSPNSSIIDAIEKCLPASPEISLDCLKWVVEFLPNQSEDTVDKIDLFSLPIDHKGKEVEALDHIISMLFKKTSESKHSAWISSINSINSYPSVSVFTRNLVHFTAHPLFVEEALRIIMTCLSNGSEDLGLNCFLKLVDLLDPQNVKQFEPQILTAFGLGCSSDDPLISAKCQLLLVESYQKLGLEGHSRVEKMLLGISLVEVDNNGEWPRQFYELSNGYISAALCKLGKPNEKSLEIIRKTAEHILQSYQFVPNSDHMICKQELIMAPKIALKCVDADSEDVLILGLSGFESANILVLAKCDLSRVPMKDLKLYLQSIDCYLQSIDCRKFSFELSVLFNAISMDYAESLLSDIVQFVKETKSEALQNDSLLRNLIKILIKFDDQLFPLVLEILADIVSLSDTSTRLKLLILSLKVILETGCTADSYQNLLRFCVKCKSVDLDLCVQAISVMILLKPELAVCCKSNSMTMRSILENSLERPTKHVLDAFKMLLTRCKNETVHEEIIAPLLAIINNNSLMVVE